MSRPACRPTAPRCSGITNTDTSAACPTRTGSSGTSRRGCTHSPVDGGASFSGSRGFRRFPHWRRRGNGGLHGTFRLPGRELFQFSEERLEFLPCRLGGPPRQLMCFSRLLELHLGRPRQGNRAIGIGASLGRLQSQFLKFDRLSFTHTLGRGHRFKGCGKLRTRSPSDANVRMLHLRDEPAGKM
jgi:hypothetical protein